MIKAHCETCLKTYETPNAWYKKRKHHFCSRECMGIWRSKTIRGENHPQYQADTKNYFSVHDWMVKRYGVAKLCENPSCPYKSKRFVWAKRHGMEYERKRENFIQLCYKCHFQYDWNDEWRTNMVKGQKLRREREKK